MKQESSLLLAAASKTTALIGRQEHLQTIQEAIYTPARTGQIIAIKGRGGMGKTRLLEELLWRAGHPDWRKKRPLTPEDATQGLDWSALAPTVISNLIDMIDIRLHGRDRFIRELRNSFRRADETGVEFVRYDQAYEEYLLRKAKGAELVSIKEVADKATQAFLDDLKQITQEKRLVWVLDTVERLRFITSDWLLQEKLLKATDLASRTYQWLEDIIRAGHLQNITLILVGRDGADEGDSFFNKVEAAAAAAPIPCQTRSITLNYFTPEQTKAYFLDLANQQADNERISQHFQDLADEKNDRYKSLWLYTGGLPVKLALYAQIVVANRTIPEPLRWPFAKACQEAGISPCPQTREQLTQSETPALRKLQWEIEENFINLLFRDPTDLHARVLLALLRAPRGLNAAQLHYLLDGNEATKPADWSPDNHRLKELSNLLVTMEDAYLIKQRGSWVDLAEALHGDYEKAYSYRLGLQDEIYRLYAEHMGPLSEPLSQEWADVRHRFTPEQITVYTQNHQDEQEARNWQYAQLHQWAAHEHTILLKRKQDTIHQEEHYLDLQIRPDDPRTFYFRELGQEEAHRRDNLEESINLVEIEQRLYSLWMDPERNFNVDYVDLGYDMHKAANQDQDFLSQTEMFVSLKDPARKFFPWTMRPDIEARQETPLQVLERVAEQEDITRWLKRFVIWKEYDRAIEFAHDVEQAIRRLPRTTQVEENRWHSINHTLSKSERLVWRYYAQFYRGQDVQAALNGLENLLKNLHQLETRTVEEIALKNEGQLERGFRGLPEKGVRSHPAYPRLRRIISYSYNTLGYGYITQGQVQKAVSCYGQALLFLRGDRGAKGHRATVLNNLARALSEQGWHSAAVCEDGLTLRRQMGAEVPLAWSLNTLALIYDDLYLPDESWPLAAKALAYFRRADEERGMGLAMLQLARSLRHKARRPRSDQGEQINADRLYTVAEGLLREAQQLPGLTREPLRLIEILIERGCLHRDRLRGTNGNIPSRHHRIHYEDALINFNKAINQATEKGYEQMIVEARVNRAWSYYYFSEWQQALDELTDLEKGFPNEYKIDRSLPRRDKLGKAWILTQLSKIHFLRGRIALAYFQEQQEAQKQQFPADKEREQRIQAIHDDPVAQKALAEAARAYLLAFAYGELFSARSPIIGVLRNDLYNRLKKFNQQELSDIYAVAHQAEIHYPIIPSSAHITPFLSQFFGIPA